MSAETDEPQDSQAMRDDMSDKASGASFGEIVPSVQVPRVGVVAAVARDLHGGHDLAEARAGGLVAHIVSHRLRVVLGLVCRCGHRSSPGRRGYRRPGSSTPKLQIMSAIGHARRRAADGSGRAKRSVSRCEREQRRAKSHRRSHRQIDPRADAPARGRHSRAQRECSTR